LKERESKGHFVVHIHTISNVALVGGGSYPQPGEIYNGVLFLDELPELEMFRCVNQGRWLISRGLRLPSVSFMLVAEYEPSPSGFFNDPDSPQTSSPHEMQRYLSKISGPLLDELIFI
jgi:magnesium chelatase family protein